MIRRVIVDTDAIIGALSEKDSLHSRAAAKFQELPKPFFTCEAVLSEACFLARTSKRRLDVLRLFEKGIVKVDFSITRELDRVIALMSSYSNVPMSYADGCLVRMSELSPEAVVLTFDSDFRIYRRNRREAIPIVS